MVGMLKNIIHTMSDFIFGEQFYNVADFIYTPNIKPVFDDYNPVMNTFDIKLLKVNSIIYTHTLYIRELFDEIKDLSAKLIIITHNSDINIDDTFEIPNSVKYWFAQNVNVVNDKIISIPIGLENKRWYPDAHKKQKIVSKVTYCSKKIKNLLYLNHNINNNVLERQDLYKILKEKSWVTTDHGKNGQDFDKYVDNIYNHKFMVCPNGNGIDTHRLWECLYLNTIPIVKSNINTQFYKDLPICFVDSWDDITQEFLNKDYERIIDSTCNYEKLKISYWRKLIQDAR